MAQCKGILGGWHYAERAGMPMTRHWAIHWARAGVRPDRGAWATGQFIGRMAELARKRGQPFAAVWVRECGAKGHHAHIVASVTPETFDAIKRLQAGWLARICGKRAPGGILRSRAVGDRAFARFERTANLDRLAAYLLKGAGPEAARTLDLSQLEPQGVIIGKRAGWTQNVGKAARRFQGSPDAGMGLIG